MAHWLDKVVILLEAPTDNLRELARMADADPTTFYLGVSIDDLDLEGQELEGMQFSTPTNPVEKESSSEFEPDQVIDQIRAASRQEERIAILLNALLKDRTKGLNILESYKRDRAKFATYALDQIRILFSDTSFNLKDELIVASIVPRLFAYTYPMNRGRLLYFLAMYLAKYPQVNAAIRNSLRRTRSMFVEEYRLEIDKLLRDASRSHD